MPLGLGDWGVFAAYSLTIVCAVVCVVYGIANWNKPAQTEEQKEISEELAWEKKDPELKDEGGKA